MHEQKIGILPQKEEMLDRLLAVDSTEYFENRLYPELTRFAGQERAPSGVVLMLQLAIHNYTQDMSIDMSIMAKVQLSLLMEDFIDALCPDAEIATAAKDFYALSMKGDI